MQADNNGAHLLEEKVLNVCDASNRLYALRKFLEDLGKVLVKKIKDSRRLMKRLTKPSLTIQRTVTPRNYKNNR